MAAYVRRALDLAMREVNMQCLYGGLSQKKESKITYKKVDFGSFYAFKKVVLKLSNLDF